MRKIIEQLYVNKFLVRAEIEKLQNLYSVTLEKHFPDDDFEKLKSAKYDEFDRINHLIDLFFEGSAIK